MAGKHIEQMAQNKFNELMELKDRYATDVQVCDAAIDDILDKPYYPKQDRDIDYYTDLRNDAQHYYDRVCEDIKDLLIEFGYCIDVGGCDQMELKENSNRFRRLKRGLFGDPTGKIRTFAIISADNPLGWKDSSEEEFKDRFVRWSNDKKAYNKESVDKMETSYLLHKIEGNGFSGLKYGGFTYVPLKGKYGDVEKSYLIFNLTLSDAKTIASDYGQESFFFANVYDDRSTIAYYQTFDNCKNYKLIEVSETISDETNAMDYFSKFGLKFRINMREFGDEVPEVKDYDAFEESFDEVGRNFSERARARRNAYREVV